MGAKVTRTPGKTSLSVLVSKCAELEKFKKGARIGWLENNKYPSVTAKKSGKAHGGLPVAQVAAIQELGSVKRGIPPRPSLKPTAQEKKENWKKILYFGILNFFKNSESIEKPFERVGLIAAGDVRKKISKIVSPPLKDKTVKDRLRKMADGKTVGNLKKPLVFTKTLLNTLTSKVE